MTFDVINQLLTDATPGSSQTNVMKYGSPFVKRNPSTDRHIQDSRNRLSKRGQSFRDIYAPFQSGEHDFTESKRTLQEFAKGSAEDDAVLLRGKDLDDKQAERARRLVGALRIHARLRSELKVIAESVNKERKKRVVRKSDNLVQAHRTAARNFGLDTETSAYVDSLLEHSQRGLDYFRNLPPPVVSTSLSCLISEHECADFVK